MSRPDAEGLKTPQTRFAVRASAHVQTSTASAPALRPSWKWRTPCALSTYQAIKAAFDAVGAQNLKGNLAALFDASDATARQRSATSDPDALLSNALRSGERAQHRPVEDRPADREAGGAGG